MRVTNNMVFSQSMNNIWRNFRHVNDIVRSIETTKRISRPSDDPLLSGRTLRFRTLLAENEQFIRNANTATSWMETTEAAFDSILTGRNSIMGRMNERLVAAADGTHELSDINAFIAEFRQMFEQLKFVDMNQTYMGRFVFSGFHTDQPPVLTEMCVATGFRERVFNIALFPRDEDFTTTPRLFRDGPNSLPEIIEPHVLQLPFTGDLFNIGATPPWPQPPGPLLGHPINAAPDNLGVFRLDGPAPLHPVFEVVQISVTDRDAYNPPAHVWQGGFDPDNPAAWAGTWGTPPNPALDASTFDRNNPTTWPSGQLPLIHFIPETGELVAHEDVRRFFENTTVTVQARDFQEGELNPMINFPSWDVTNGNEIRHNSEEHDFRLEIAVNSQVTINSHARNILTPQMYADWNNLFRIIGAMNPSDPQAVRAYYMRDDNHLGEALTGARLDEYVSRFLSDEKARFASVAHDLFNNMLQSHERHAANMQSQHTALGSRMMRLDMLHIRLEEDEIAYTALMSESEDTDIPSAIMRKNSAEAAFNSALRAIAMVNQLSLADFINR